MTLVVLPGGIQKSGSSGGTVSSRNRYGAYERTRSVPVNPNTDRQAAVRSYVSLLTIAWQNTLTQAERDAWEVYAANVPWKNKLGQVIYLTGFNHYVRSNVVRLQLTADCPATVRVDVAPIIFNLATPEQGLQVSGSVATQNITITYDDSLAWAAEAGAFEAFYLGLPQNPSINFFGGPWKYLTVACGGGVPASPFDFPSVYPIGLNQKIWLRSRIGRADARLSEHSRVSGVVAA